MIKLAAFLGNPGIQYEHTRHNIGWKIASESSFLYGLDWQQKFKGVYARKMINREKVLFLKPQTYMNKSGESVQALMRFFKIESQDLLVVHDDVELDFGQVGFKKGGGLAGHNGLRSIASALSGPNFYRFRLGISRPTRGDVSSYVLGKFSPDEREALPLYLQKASAALEYCLCENIESAVKKYKKVTLI